MDFEYTLVFKKLVSVYKVDPPAGDYSTATWKEGRMAVGNPWETLEHLNIFSFHSKL